MLRRLLRCASFLLGPRDRRASFVEIFVAVLGASNLTYAEAVLSQKVDDFVGAHVRALTYFGGVPTMLVPDGLKAAVTVACRYEPGIHVSVR